MNSTGINNRRSKIELRLAAHSRIETKIHRQPQQTLKQAELERRRQNKSNKEARDRRKRKQIQLETP